MYGPGLDIVYHSLVYLICSIQCVVVDSDSDDEDEDSDTFCHYVKRVPDVITCWKYMTEVRS